MAEAGVSSMARYGALTHLFGMAWPSDRGNPCFTSEGPAGPILTSRECFGNKLSAIKRMAFYSHKYIAWRYITAIKA